MSLKIAILAFNMRMVTLNERLKKVSNESFYLLRVSVCGMFYFVFLGLVILFAYYPV